MHVERTEHAIATEHCHHIEEPHIDVIKKIAAVALIAFSAQTSFYLFMGSFAAGIAIGLYQRMLKEKCVDITPISSCVHSFLEQATGAKLPEVISLLGTAGLTAHHIEHCPEVGVPLSGLIAGIWLVQRVDATYKSIFSVGLYIF